MASLARRVQEKFDLTEPDARSLVAQWRRRVLLRIALVFAVLVISIMWALALGWTAVMTFLVLFCFSGLVGVVMGLTHAGSGVIYTLEQNHREGRCLRCSYPVYDAVAGPRRARCPECGLDNPPPPTHTTIDPLQDEDR